MKQSLLAQDIQSPLELLEQQSSVCKSKNRIHLLKLWIHKLLAKSF